MDDRVALAADPSDFNSVVFTTFGMPEPGSEQDEMDERYRAMTGHHPASSVAALGYDAGNVLEYAILNASSTRRALLAASMRGLTSGTAGDRATTIPGGHITTHRLFV